MIKEDFLHFIWQSLKFRLDDLRTTEGQPVLLIDKGYLNNDAGPDFTSARVQIKDILWIGNIEIHVRASDWYRHNHQNDPQYDNVILHVVLEEDEPVIDRQNRRIPCLELKDRIPREELRKYRLLQNQPKVIPCSDLISSVPRIHLISAMEQSLSIRLQNKASRFIHLLEKNTGNWEYSFLILLARQYGSTVNGDLFEQLIRSVPPNVFYREREELIRLEALLFGQAGLPRQAFSTEYPEKLRFLHSFQCTKYGIKPAQLNWKFLRMRPHNFPTVRIAQLAALLHTHDAFIDTLRMLESKRDFLAFFNVPVSSYWQEHYDFEKKNIKQQLTPGKDFRELLLINAVVPLLFALGIEKNNGEYRSKALDLLASIPPENNKIIRIWKELGALPENAFDSQGLLELYRTSCSGKKCLSCPVGQHLVSEC